MKKKEKKGEAAVRRGWTQVVQSASCRAVSWGWTREVQSASRKAVSWGWIREIQSASGKGGGIVSRRRYHLVDPKGPLHRRCAQISSLKRT